MRLELNDLKAIERFKISMIKKLNTKKNSKKKHWKSHTVNELKELLFNEYVELNSSIINKDLIENIQDECIDVANFAFFIYNNLEDKNEIFF